jgi:hypothetical protein
MDGAKNGNLMAHVAGPHYTNLFNVIDSHVFSPFLRLKKRGCA